MSPNQVYMLKNHLPFKWEGKDPLEVYFQIREGIRPPMFVIWGCGKKTIVGRDPRKTRGKKRGKLCLTDQQKHSREVIIQDCKKQLKVKEEDDLDPESLFALYTLLFAREAEEMV